MLEPGSNYQQFVALSDAIEKLVHGEALGDRPSAASCCGFGGNYPRATILDLNYVEM